MNDMSPGKIRRLVFILSGATDALIGAAILLLGFGFLPVEIVPPDVPGWVLILIGAIMFVAGVWVAVYNFSRLEE
jgi:hypothetical protein